MLLVFNSTDLKSNTKNIGHKYLHHAWARLMYLAMGKTLADNTPVPILSVRLTFDECLSRLDGGFSPHVHPDQRPAQSQVFLVLVKNLLPLVLDIDI